MLGIGQLAQAELGQRLPAKERSAMTALRSLGYACLLAGNSVYKGSLTGV